MKWFYNLKLATKMISGFIIVALIAGIIGVLGIFNIRTIDDADTYLYEQMTVPLGDMIMIAESFQRMRGNVKDVILSAGDPTAIDNYAKDIEARNNEFDQYLAAFETTLITDEAKNEVAHLRANKAEYDKVVMEIINLVKEGKIEQAENLNYGVGNDIRREVQAEVDSLKTSKINLAAQTAAENTATANAATAQSIIIMIIGILISIGLGIFISTSIKNPVNVMVAAAERIADGDLNVDIAIDTKDEIGILAAAFRRMADNVNEVMTDINSAAEQVSAGSSQVADSSQQLSQGATEQASSVEEITASMEELSAQTNQNAANAGEANNISTQAKADAEQGNHRMKEMLVSMDEINESSRNISKIIKVIDEIAFQTNILALNAAVEAARAGQHGKGFAVVAEEVRNLAARSANAAKETTELIEGSIQKVGAGTNIAQETAKALENIVSGVTDAARLVSEIAKASNEQASGIEQVNEAIMQVSQVTQTNSATSEEAAAASEELSSQAQLLKDAVNRFKLKHANQRGRGNFDSQSRDMLKMLGNGDDFQGSQTEKSPKRLGGGKKKISLDDQEFGKY